MWDPDLEQSIGTVPYFVLGTRDSVAQTFGRKGIIAQTAGYVWLKKIVLQMRSSSNQYLLNPTRAQAEAGPCATAVHLD